MKAGVMDKQQLDCRYTVLVVDDSADDRFFLRRSLGEESRLSIIHELDDGEEALAYLSGEGKFADRAAFPVPDLMLLDLKMPKKSGHEVLEWLQEKEMTRPVVVVLTNSIRPEDLTRSLDLGAAAFHVKTSEREAEPALIRALEKLLDQRVGVLR